MLRKPELVEQMMTWSIELLEYDMAYELRGTIWAQVLDDFINELHPPPSPRTVIRTGMMDDACGQILQPA